MSSTAMAAEPVHGLGGGKSCTRIPRICDTDADCPANSNECAENFCDTTIAPNLRCVIEVRYNDGFDDILTITDVYDLVKANPIDVRQPPSGHAEIIDAVGETPCTIGGTLPCTMGPGLGVNTLVQFVVDTYEPDDDDPNPLQDWAFIEYTDSCTGSDTSGSCVVDQPPKIYIQQSNLQSGCDERPLPPSTDCTDTGLDCWDAGCDGAGTCVQEHVPVAASTTCDDVADTEECANPGCDGAGNCVADHIWEPDSTDCTDTGEECWDAGCESGVCVQEHVPVAASTPCTDDGLDDCYDPGCDGAGSCDQQHVPLQCGDAICRTPGFWGARGGDEKSPKSQNITQDVIDSVPGGLDVCGTFITNTNLNSKQSAIEAICVSVKGDLSRQLVRQLTAAALNCALAPCGDDIEALVAS